jgi:hypothetical protein
MLLVPKSLWLVELVGAKKKHLAWGDLIWGRAPVPITLCQKSCDAAEKISGVMIRKVPSAVCKTCETTLEQFQTRLYDSMLSRGCSAEEAVAELQIFLDADERQ